MPRVSPARTPRAVARARLARQHLLAPAAHSATELVGRLGAVQAQDYAGAKWGMGQRLDNATDAALDRLFDAGAILRTHVLRPTWHFVAPDDIRWLLALTAPRVHAVNAYYYRQCGFDARTLTRSQSVIARALAGGATLTRRELGDALAGARIDTSGSLRLGYLMMHAELEQVICSGPRRGKEFTYALLDDRVPPTPPRPPDDSLAELAVRYFTTRGPATPHDFAWWSGLSVGDARTGIELAGGRLRRCDVAGAEGWEGNDDVEVPARAQGVHLLPNYDEFFIGFRDRGAIGERVAGASIDPAVTFAAHVIVADGQLVGGWRRTLRRRTVDVHLDVVTPLSPREQARLDREQRRYARFLGVELGRG